jgi:type IV pilus assembly protein PilC
MVLFGSISAQERINFARHLHLTTRSGLPLIEGLSLVGAQSSRGLKNIIRQIIEDINNGKLLGEALMVHQRVFGEFFVHIVQVGEQSGRLSENLLYLSEELKRRKETRGKVRAALIYPVIILIATVGIAGFLVFFVLPKILPILTDLSVELPATTKFLIAVVDFFSLYGAYVGIGLVVFFIGSKLLLRVPPVRYVVHWVLLLIPVVSTMTRHLIMTRFSRSLGLLLKSGVNLVEALRVTSGTLGNYVYRREVERVVRVVQKGGSIADYLVTRRRRFPIMFANLIRVGERTGNLEDNLFYLSEYYKDEVEDSIKNLTAILEPVLLLFMGLLVGFIAISIILPIYKISSPQL